MSLSEVAPGQVSDGRAKVLFVPVIAKPGEPTLAELTATGVIDLTYQLFGDGFDHQTEVTKFETSRYTLEQLLENEGTVKDTITLKYPYMGTESDEVRTGLTRGTTGYVVERLVVANEVPFAADQLLSIVAPVRAGLQREIPRTKNTEIGKIQDLLVTGRVERDVKVAAGP
ncbi:hypothetical protein EDF60_1690 [Leucobacter luti]|uniref:phage tail tube protein n=1 Tax=Leucobacter luti TaxID=340320 RepID=UPI00104441FF|nr:hypothetical protein [Leucobacter luti]MCW2287039.1 hypothetical protein [Leucobacter luti]TCK41264.1 hypothetical protein EDF60_1690 [Leucobacter luti]